MNYFGTLQNIQVENATIAYLLTDLANGHTFVNCTCRGIYWYGFRLHGAYGNSFSGGFLEIAHRNGIIGRNSLMQGLAAWQVLLGVRSLDFTPPNGNGAAVSRQSSLAH